VCATALTFAPGAAAFCRTMTCDTKEQTCAKDSKGCVTDGLPVYWPGRCVSFGVQKDGSPKRNISYEDAERVIHEAYRPWIAADCDGRPPSLTIFDLGEPHGGIECAEPEFNHSAPNANVWMFRDQDWPYEGADGTLALTTLTFEVSSGKILDADVEVNSFGQRLTIGDEHIGDDLLSIATHEAGHFLGLAHSNKKSATMTAEYSSRDVAMRTLDPDDVDGICEIYPPDRDAPSCEKYGPIPDHGFTRFCVSGLELDRAGCSVSGGAPPEGTAPPLGVLVALAATGLALERARRRQG
jgi:hypothetical protein